MKDKPRLILQRLHTFYIISEEPGLLYKSFCKRDIERITGIKLKPGETREIKSITITLKPAKKKAKK